MKMEHLSPDDLMFRPVRMSKQNKRKMYKNEGKRPALTSAITSKVSSARQARWKYPAHADIPNEATHHHPRTPPIDPIISQFPHRERHQLEHAMQAISISINILIRTILNRPQFRPTPTLPALPAGNMEKGRGGLGGILRVAIIAIAETSKYALLFRLCFCFVC